MSTQKQPTFKKLILDELKQKGLTSIVKKIKSVRYSTYAGGSSLDVTIIDPTKTEREALKPIVEQYQAGHFNGMEDIYEYREVKTARSVKYAFMNVEYSDAAKAEVAEEIKQKFGVSDDAESMKTFGCWLSQAIFREIQKKESFGKAA